MKTEEMQARARDVATQVLKRLALIGGASRTPACKLKLPLTGQQPQHARDDLAEQRLQLLAR